MHFGAIAWSYLRSSPKYANHNLDMHTTNVKKPEAEEFKNSAGIYRLWMHFPANCESFSGSQRQECRVDEMLS